MTDPPVNGVAVPEVGGKDDEISGYKLVELGPLGPGC
jgi:hypothetical protein